MLQNLALTSFAGGARSLPFTIRPDSNVTQTEFNDGYAEIDDEIASDSDFAWSNNNQVATLEVGLADPPHSPIGGITIVRYRVWKTDNGTPTPLGTNVSVTCHVYEGATLIDSDVQRTTGSAWAGYSFTPDMSAVSDWTDLRLRFVTTSANRGLAISWAVLEWSAN